MSGPNNIGTPKASTAPLNAGNPGSARTTILTPPPNLPPQASSDNFQTTLSGSLPAAKVLNADEQAKINSLPAQVRVRVLSQGIPSSGDATAIKQQVIANLQSAIKDLVPGGINFSNQGGQDGASWQIPELADMYQVVSAMPPADRQMLSGIDFSRQHQVNSADLAAGQQDMAKSQDLGQQNSKIFAGFSTVVPDQAKPGDSGGLIQMAKSLVHAVLGLFGLGSSSKDGAKRQIVLTDAGVFGLDGQGAEAVIAHEVGMQMQWQFGGWNPDRLSQFGQISDWTTGPDGREVAKNKSEMVSRPELSIGPNGTKTANIQYSTEALYEDFAESYATYLTDPAQLLTQAPEKFLFINAYSGKYNPQQVAALAVMDGTNLTQVATRMVQAGNLRQDTLDTIMKVNGIKADAVGMGSASVASSNDPLAEATAIMADKAAIDPNFQKILLSPPTDPVAVKAWGTQLFGSTWGQLSPSEQALMQDSAFMSQMIADLKSGNATASSVYSEEQYRIYKRGTTRLAQFLLGTDTKDIQFRAQFANDPVGTLTRFRIWDELPPNVQKALANPASLPKLAALAQALSSSPGVDQGTITQNIRSFVEKMSVDGFSNDLDSQVMKDPQWAQKEAANLDNIRKTGMPLPGLQGGPDGGW